MKQSNLNPMFQNILNGFIKPQDSYFESLATKAVYACEVCDRTDDLVEVNYYDKADDEPADNVCSAILCETHARKRTKEMEREGEQVFWAKAIPTHDKYPLFYVELESDDEN